MYCYDKIVAILSGRIVRFYCTPIWWNISAEHEKYHFSTGTSAGRLASESQDARNVT